MTLDHLEAIEAVTPEPIGYLNHYACHFCHSEWEDEWTCQVDDECPNCGRTYSPCHSEEITEKDL